MPSFLTTSSLPPFHRHLRFFFDILAHPLPRLATLICSLWRVFSREKCRCPACQSLHCILPPPLQGMILQTFVLLFLFKFEVPPPHVFFPRSMNGNPFCTFPSEGFKRRGSLSPSLLHISVARFGLDGHTLGLSNKRRWLQ